MKGIEEMKWANKFAVWLQVYFPAHNQAPSYQGLSPAGYRAAANARWPNGDVKGVN